MKKYDFSASEKKYSALWKEERVYEPDLDKAKKPFYNLMMFPYPSAEGLHVGNMYAFTGSDIYGRFKRMQGYDVFEPIGLDGFGIHSENYSLKIGAHPMEQAKRSEENFYRQLEMVGNGFAWDEKAETYDPAYYRWTQWLFTEMWKAGLAYRKKQSVNWCPKDKTVLADEQVIAGKCERCDSAVEKKELEQWFFRITKYAEKLLKNLDGIDWSERVKTAQRNWIGRSEGARIKFQIPDSPPTGDLQKGDKFKIHEIEVFTTRPDTLFGATYLAVSPELASEWLSAGWDAPAEVKKYASVALASRNKYGDRVTIHDKTGVFSGIYAVNPATKEKIPVWVSDYVLSGYGTGAIMAVPAHDARDFEFAKKFKLPVRKVIEPPRIVPEPIPGQAVPDAKIVSECWEGEGELINSGKFDGMDSEKAKRKIAEFAGGKMEVQYRLRDWLLSRQRYWGAPIPMVFCEACAASGKGEQKEMPGWYAVKDEDLPVKLPYVKDWKPMGTGVSPLASVKEFYEAKCPHCGAAARRETDVSDTFLDSAWYYLRYLDVGNKSEPFGRKRAKHWLPVGMYIGGLEHSVLHLLYVRFVAMALKDMGRVDFEEPIAKFRAHGLLVHEGAKMSKSKGNVVNPDEYVKRHGADAFRMYLMFLAPFEEGGDFRDEGILGPARFLERVRKLVERLSDENSEASERALHRTVKKVTEDIGSLRYNTAISALMILMNEFEKEKSVFRGHFEAFAKLLAPFAPFLSEELWREALGHGDSVHLSAWPEYDPKKIIEDTFTLVIQVNGRVRGQIEVPAGISEKEAKERAEPEVKRFLAGGVKRAVYVPGRLVNFVVLE